MLTLLLRNWRLAGVGVMALAIFGLWLLAAHRANVIDGLEARIEALGATIQRQNTEVERWKAAGEEQKAKALQAQKRAAAILASARRQSAPLPSHSTCETSMQWLRDQSSSLSSW